MKSMQEDFRRWVISAGLAMLIAGPISSIILPCPWSSQGSADNQPPQKRFRLEHHFFTTNETSEIPYSNSIQLAPLRNYNFELNNYYVHLEE